MKTAQTASSFFSTESLNLSFSGTLKPHLREATAGKIWSSGTYSFPASRILGSRFPQQSLLSRFPIPLFFPSPFRLFFTSSLLHFVPSSLRPLSPSVPQSLSPSVSQSLSLSVSQSLSPSVPQSLSLSVSQSLNLDYRLFCVSHGHGTARIFLCLLWVAQLHTASISNIARIAKLCLVNLSFILKIFQLYPVNTL